MNYNVLYIAITIIIIIASRFDIITQKIVSFTGVKTVTRQQNKEKTGRDGKIVLVAFFLLTLIMISITIFYYRTTIRINADKMFSVIWLLLTMIFGMFVQVISTKVSAGKAPFQIKADELIYPMLFSILVFYPIWIIANNSELNYLTFYTAFLNGYFWETVVTKAKSSMQQNENG